MSHAFNWRIDPHLMSSLTCSGRGWFCGTGRHRACISVWNLGKPKKSAPQKTSQTGCLVTGLQLQGRTFSSWSLLDNIENPNYGHKKKITAVKEGIWIQHLKDKRQIDYFREHLLNLHYLPGGSFSANFSSIFRNLCSNTWVLVIVYLNSTCTDYLGFFPTFC